MFRLPSGLALTPVLTTVEVYRQFQVPEYSSASASYWNYPCPPGGDHDSCLGIGARRPDIMNEGTFTYRPWRGRLPAHRHGGC